MTIEHHLVPARFLTTMSHFMLVLLAYTTRRVYIVVTLPVNFSQQQYNDRNTEFLAALWLSIISFIVEFTGLFIGFSLFRMRHNLFYTITHIIGFSLTFWLVVDNWSYRSFWPICVVFSIIPALLEATLILRHYACKVIQY